MGIYSSRAVWGSVFDRRSRFIRGMMCKEMCADCGAVISELLTLIMGLAPRVCYRQRTNLQVELQLG